MCSKIKDVKALVVLLVDLCDVAGTIMPRLRELIGGNPVIVVGTKVDMLPPEVRLPHEFKRWLEKALNNKGLTPLETHLVSSEFCGTRRQVTHCKLK